MVMKVIDVSKHNGVIDFAKVKASGIDGVIIRAGFGKTAEQKDQMFEINYRTATAAGLHVGAYWYSYAKNAEEAKQEANAFLYCIREKVFDLPVYLDIEEKGSQAVNAPEIVRAFCSEMERNGYFVGVYASKSYLETYIKEAVNPYSVWVANWSNNLNYNGKYDMWQHSSTGRIEGVSGDVDLDYCYKNFPEIIKAAGLNGYGTTEEPEKDNIHVLQVFVDCELVYEKEFRGFEDGN